jgi:hypothetical protein
MIMPYNSLLMQASQEFSLALFCHYRLTLAAKSQNNGIKITLSTIPTLFWAVASRKDYNKKPANREYLFLAGTKIGQAYLVSIWHYLSFHWQVLSIEMAV